MSVAVRPQESIAETQPQLHPALLRRARELQPCPFCFGIFLQATRSRTARRNFSRSPGSHCSIGSGRGLGQLQWRDRRYPHWFSKYHRARHRSRWPDLGDSGPCSRRGPGREDPSRRPRPPSGRRRFRRRQRERACFCDVFCSNDGNVPHSSNAAGVPLEVNGDFRIDGRLSPAPPNTCTSPVLLIRSTSGSWFAAGIPE